MPAIDRLIEMLRYMRPAGSATERAYIHHYIAGLPTASQDAYRNWHVRVGKEPTILWSSHTDTVHRQEGMQRVQLNSHTGIIALSKKAQRKGSNCLGADDTVGNWLMVEMIARKIPGHYIFHYGEERGGQGSSDLAHYRPEWLKQFTFAIALDRRGHSDIITHQAMGKSASNAFAVSLADILNSAGPFTYKPSPNGIYTDTANYTDLIPECSNVSVGYHGEHGDTEWVDSCHAEFLLDALCAVRAELLVAEREPGDDGWQGSTWWGSTGYYTSGGVHYSPKDYDYGESQNDHWMTCAYYKDAKRDCTCGLWAELAQQYEDDANDTPPQLDEDGVPLTVDTRSYLDKEYARVTAHLSATTPLVKQTRWSCPLHGPFQGYKCPQCSIRQPMDGIIVNETAMVPVKAKDTLLADMIRTDPPITPTQALSIVASVERARAELAAKTAKASTATHLTPSERLIAGGNRVVRAWRREHYKIRRPGRRPQGAWAMSPSVRDPEALDVDICMAGEED